MIAVNLQRVRAFYSLFTERRHLPARSIKIRIVVLEVPNAVLEVLTATTDRYLTSTLSELDNVRLKSMCVPLRSIGRAWRS